MVLETRSNSVGVELPKPERTISRSLTLEQPVIQIDEYIACSQRKSVASSDLDWSIDCNPLRVEVVASLVGGNQHWPLRLIESREHPPNIDEGSVRVWLDGAVCSHHELLAFIVGPGVARGLDSHALWRALNLFLVEDEADVTLLLERRERENREQYSNGTGQEDLCPTNKLVMSATGLRPTRLGESVAVWSFSHRGRKYPARASPPDPKERESE